MKIVRNGKECLDWSGKLGLTKHKEGDYYKEIYRSEKKLGNISTHIILPQAFITFWKETII